jgi:hypothetical protein
MKGTAWTRLLPTASYELNLHFVLGLQQCGGGEADSAVHSGMLDLNISPFKRTWQKVEQEIGLLEIAEGKKIVDQNIQLKVELTINKEQAIVFERIHGCRSML